jgi:hypothetical protein
MRGVRHSVGIPSAGGISYRLVSGCDTSGSRRRRELPSSSGCPARERGLPGRRRRARCEPLGKNHEKSPALQGGVFHASFAYGLALDGRVLFGTARGAAANVPGVNRMNPAPATPQDQRGALYIFEQARGGTWTERATVVPPIEGDLSFGPMSATISADAGTLVLGAQAGTATGSLYPRAFVY